MQKLLTLFLALLLTMAFSKSQAQENEDLLITRTLNSKGRSTETLLYFEKNIIKPSNELLIEKGNAYYLNGDFKNAANQYYEANKNNAQLANYELAQCYAQMKKPDLACAYLTQHLKSKKRNMQNFIRTDVAFSPISNSPEWINLWNTDWYSKYELMYEDAWYEFKNGNYQEALSILNKLTDIRKSMHQAYYLKALVYEQLNEKENALISIDIALGKNTEEAEYYYIKSRLELDLQKHKKAIKSINNALFLDSTCIDYYFIRAKANLKAGNQQEATADIELLVNLLQDAQTYFLAGQLYTQTDEWQLAIKAFNKCITLEPYNPTFYIARGDAYLKTRVFDFAEKDFSFVLDFQPNNGEIYFKRGSARLELKRMDEACSDFNKAYNLKYMLADDYIKTYCQKYFKL